MNERIKSLLNVCGMPNEDLMDIYSDPHKTFYIQKFAELIVKEVFDRIEEERFEVHKPVIQQVMKHFGINK